MRHIYCNRYQTKTKGRLAFTSRVSTTRVTTESNDDPGLGERHAAQEGLAKLLIGLRWCSSSCHSWKQCFTAPHFENVLLVTCMRHRFSRPA